MSLPNPCNRCATELDSFQEIGSNEVYDDDDDDEDDDCFTATFVPTAG